MVCVYKTLYKNVQAMTLESGVLQIRVLPGLGGNIVTLGNTSIRCLHTPGHTPGSLSFFFDVAGGECAYHVGMHGGVGMNSMEREFLDRYNLPDTCRTQFLERLDQLRQEPVDIILGNHVGNNDTLGKARRLRADGPNPFIDPAEWPRFLDQCEQRITKLIRKGGIS